MRWLVVAVLAGWGCGASVGGDEDEDGFIATEFGGTDCDDADPDVNPDAAERCGDGVDNDCDGRVDDRGVGNVTWYQDLDGDGFGGPESPQRGCPGRAPEVGLVEQGGDCDDDAPGVNPGVPVDSCDLVDEDCDLEIDEDAPPASVDGIPYDDVAAAFAALESDAAAQVVEICAPGDPAAVSGIAVGGTRAITLRGSGGTVVSAVEAVDDGPLVRLSAEASLVVEWLAISGSATGPALHVAEQAELQVFDSELTSNPGGAILVEGAEPVAGSDPARLTVARSWFETNGSPGVPGGAIAATGWFDVSLAGLTLRDNVGSEGGALHVASSAEVPPRFEWRDLVVEDNTGATGGGAFLEQVSVSMLDSTIRNNRAVDAAGAMVRRSVLTGLGGLEVVDNVASDKAGGLLVEGSAVSTLRVAGNASSEGGGLLVRAAEGGSARSQLTAVWVEGNEAQLGGGVQVAIGAGAELVDSTVVANNATLFGGGAYLEGVQSGLVSTASHWGADAGDNTPNDVELPSGEAFDFDAASSDFVCSADLDSCITTQ